MSIALQLRKPLPHGSERKLTPAECRAIVKLGTSVQPYPGEQWTLVRNMAGNIGLWWRCKSGEGAMWHVAEVAP